MTNLLMIGFSSKILFNVTRNVAVVKSDKDSRYGLASIVTHDGAKMACLALSELTSFRNLLGPEAYDKVHS
jgi:thymidine kinase